MSFDASVRSRVLRGPAAAGIPGVALDADLSLLRPLTPLTPAGSVNTEAAAQAMRAEAKRVGYEDGFTAGRDAGLAEGRSATAAALAQLQSALDAVETAAAGLTSRQADAVAEVERHVATLAVEIAESILGRELASIDSAARDALVRALQLAPRRVDAIARLHPDDAATIGEVADLAADRTVTVIADAAVEPGGCIVDAGACRIDAQITPALQRVREVLGG